MSVIGNLKKVTAAAAALVLLAGCGGKKSSENKGSSENTTAAVQNETAQSNDGIRTPAEYEELSEKLCMDMTEGSFQAMIALFSDEMKAQVTEEALVTGWAQINSIAGSFRSIKSTESDTDENGYTVTNTLLEFENKNIVVLIAYNKEGLIDGALMNFAQEETSKGPQETDTYAETSVKVGEHELDGMLTMPKNAEKPPVVILIQGSGQTDMDENVGIAAPFRDIAHALAEKGIASIRYNKRFFQYPELESEDTDINDEILDDADAAVELARQYAEEGKVDSIFVLGHSLGGTLVPSVAARNSEVKGIISLAGTPRNMAEVWLEQLDAQLGMVDGEVKGCLEKLIEQIKTMQEKKEYLETDNPPQYQIFFNVAYWTSLAEIDPVSIAKGLDIPMLFMQGRSDTQVFADKDYAMWQEGLGDRPNCQFKLYDGMGHLFNAEMGHIDSQVIEDTADFIMNCLA